MLNQYRITWIHGHHAATEYRTSKRDAIERAYVIARRRVSVTVTSMVSGRIEASLMPHPSYNPLATKGH